MALISKSTIQEVNTRLDAVSVIGEYIRLEKKSGRWWGRCPFHSAGQEKTPSFKVDPESKMYYCFGCNKGGSVISFIMEMEKINYPEAIKNLAAKMSIEIIYEEGFFAEAAQDNSVKDELFELYKRLTVTFQHFLHEKGDNEELNQTERLSPSGNAALEYIKNRGISDEMIDIFKLGFSPVDRDFLYNFLKKKSYSDEFLAKSGLFSSRYKTIPLFSGRLMFPIADKQGRIVAFGGRALPGIIQANGKEPPKYINSPETEIYKKGQTLFAIDQAKTQMRQSKTVYLAEGYMDVIALHQAGITNSVAPLGTAFTDEQAFFLRQWVDKIILLFDNDEAGKKAAYKAIITCRKNNIFCTVADMHEGLKKETDTKNYDKFKDPADILKDFGPQILKNILKFTTNDFEYLILHSKNQYNVTKGSINSATEYMYPYLEALESEIDCSDSITRIADFFKIERNAVQNDYFKWKTARFRTFDEKPDTSNNPAIGSKPRLDIRRSGELNLLTNIALNMDLYPEFRAVIKIKDIDDITAKEIFIALEECYKHDENSLDSLLIKIYDENLRNFIVNRGTSGEFKGDSRRFMEDGINLIKIKLIKKRLTEINSQMRESERKSETIENVNDLLAEKKILDAKIRKLEGR
ncbi:MAG: DNA primase [Treponema sp.]|nr:DNA primase [Treponema sp.]